MGPSYLKLHRSGELRERIAAALAILRQCRVCPRRCGANRLADERGYCQSGRYASVASFSPHFGEESPLVGDSGSGTIFLSSCNLLCAFCQNFEISHLAEGTEARAERLASMMLTLAGRGCHNINFVTPTHFTPQILEALPFAIDMGLEVPLVYNCGGYEETETLRLLDGVFDIYMPDFKFWDDRWSMRFCSVTDYREKATAALREMHRQVGDLEIHDGIARKGLLVRHLVMPNGVAGTREVVEFISRELSPNTYINIMDQYRPCGKAHKDRIISRSITGEEYRQALDWARDAGLRRLDSRARFR